MAKYITKQIKVELEVIIRVEPVPNNSCTYDVTTESGHIHQVTWRESPKEGDYLNITNPDNIYHMPRHIVDGPNAKYEIFKE